MFCRKTSSQPVPCEYHAAPSAPLAQCLKTPLPPQPTWALQPQGHEGTEQLPYFKSTEVKQIKKPHWKQPLLTPWKTYNAIARPAVILTSFKYMVSRYGKATRDSLLSALLPKHLYFYPQEIQLAAWKKTHKPMHGNVCLRKNILHISNLLLAFSSFEQVVCVQDDNA